MGEDQESCSDLPSTGRGAGGTVCHPSPTPSGCGRGVGMVLSQVRIPGK